MILFTNGDSWTQGDSPAQTPNWEATKTEDWYDIVPNFGTLDIHDDIIYNLNKGNPDTRVLYKFYDSSVWPKVLGKKLNLETWNAGRLGDSCHGIVNRTIQSIEWLKKQGKNNIFAIIGWTSHLRVPFYYVDKDKIKSFQLRPGGCFEGIFKEIDFANVLRDKYSEPKSLLTTFIINIITLQNYFKVNNIEYLMFNAFNTYQDIDKHLLYDTIDKSRWVNCTVKPAHFKEFILQKYNLPDWKESKYFVTMHPTDISHIAWGDYLYNYIQTL